ncbi:glycine betaine ABC transporter substrate-binding protein [Motiliproteus sp. MSK22-1]|uniref:glycine betaine ABC transporter substrate-binding protein n=1 Tax=Motiliproteus sp. MSK22-1 TaxID=1897630 RepID=UPI000978AA80|nr:glycine betaine ABC transporter substrate-binding protein [Motiliproteus sp. MSK22-1]OMH36216.1 glycine/betaine ABC transporter [Motiliproteus sp. MSK22-1]
MSKTITIGVTDLSFHRVTASLVVHTLKSMGFEVNRIYSPHQDNFKKLKTAEVDLLSSAWLPSSHGVYKSDVEESVPLIELGLHYEPYALWGVPAYVPVEMVAGVADLLKPDVLAKMKPDIQGINPGAGITRFSIEMMDRYQLSKAGYRFHTGTEEDCFNAFERAVASQEWIVVPLWKPQFLHYKYDIREIKEPKGLLGTVDRAVLLLREDKKTLFSQAQLNILDALRFSNDIIAELDYQVSRENRPLDEVTFQWLQSQGSKES